MSIYKNQAAAIVSVLAAVTFAACEESEKSSPKASSLELAPAPVPETPKPDSHAASAVEPAVVRPAAVIPAPEPAKLPPFEVVSDNKVGAAKRTVDVRLSARLAESELIAIAAAVKAQSPRSFARTYVNFDVPKVKVYAYTHWAHVVFEQGATPRAQVFGFSASEFAAAKAETLSGGNRKVVGSWLEEGLNTAVSYIYSEGSQFFFERRYLGRDSAREKLTVKRVGNQFRFSQESSEDFFILARDNSLEYWEVRSGSTGKYFTGAPRGSVNRAALKRHKN